MSRSGYSDDCDGWALICWRGAVASAIRGERGQKLLRDALAALDAMPTKRLIQSALVRPDGECCTLGSVAIARGLEVSKLDPFEREEVAEAFGIAPALAAEIAHENDECGPRWRFEDGRSFRLDPETPEQRWVRMRAWVAKQIRELAP